MTENYYRVVASTQTRDPYPVYKFYNDPEDWSCNGTVKISCKDGNVDVTIFEKDSINIHRLSASGPARLTEQTSHPDRP
jgi:hypothetical protein